MAAALMPKRHKGCSLLIGPVLFFSCIKIMTNYDRLEKKRCFALKE